MIENLNNRERTHSCGALRKENVGERVTLMGWCARRRDFGPLTFIDLRDRGGITQIVVNHENAPQASAKAKEVRGEYVIAAIGEVVLRDETARNPKLATGDVEVQATEIIILNDAKTLPFQLDASDESLAAEDLRLKYRYLDLRRPQLQANLRLRHRMILEINRYMDEQGFTQIETPNLIKSTPEGARDYIVPSRVQPGKFFALPQSPQIFKQICMIAGLDKYYQIARCFRDEDLRADRQPEFSQLDVELSFATPDQIYELVEGLFARIFRLQAIELQTPFPRFTFADVMRRFGSDKPDMRIEGMELQDLSATLAETTFAPYAGVLSAGGEIKGIVVSGGASMSRKTLDELQEFAKRYGSTALAWIKLGDELSSSLLKVLGHDTVVDLAGVAGAQKGDAVLIVAGKSDVVAASLGALRNEIARRENLVPENVFAPLWVTDFPMFEFHGDDGRYYSMHHPFTSPLDEDLPVFERAVNGETELFGEIRAKAYDAVINGVEVAGGSIRIHRRDVQSLVFKALGMTEEMARARFGFFLEALAYGTPPHGGIASGIERTLMVLVPTENIRDVMAFPKTASAQDLMIDAPGEVDYRQLDELHLTIGQHKSHEPFNEEVFRRLVNEALTDLPSIVLDPKSKLEEKEVAVLERLLEKVARHCGVIQGLEFEDLSNQPRKLQLIQQIIGVIEFDSLHNHATSVFFRKQPIIKEFLDKALPT
ncbi:MAG TPA: aspartate--tRNA ligase [Pyrinomonadaceae bacterium]|nr:aspartate--tRNA ligase [Pyrinomonadaceae bacterium]